MKKTSIKFKIELVQWFVLLLWGVVIWGSASSPIFMKFSKIHTIFPLLVAGLSILQYYLAVEDEKLKMLKRIPYLLFVSLLFWVCIRWEKKTYMEPRAKQIMEQKINN